MTTPLSVPAFAPVATDSVPRRARLLDLASLAALAIGGGIFARSWLAMRDLQAGGLVRGGPSRSAVTQFNYYASMSRLGIGLGVCAVVIAVIAAVVGRKGRFGDGLPESK